MFEGIRASLFFEEFRQRDWIFLFLNNINPFVAESVPVCCVHLHLGSLPSVSFKLRKLRSETAGPNGLGFVEVTLCDNGLRENFVKFRATALFTKYHCLVPLY